MRTKTEITDGGSHNRKMEASGVNQAKQPNSQTAKQPNSQTQRKQPTSTKHNDILYIYKTTK